MGASSRKIHAVALAIIVGGVAAVSFDYVPVAAARKGPPPCTPSGNCQMGTNRGGHVFCNPSAHQALENLSPADREQVGRAIGEEPCTAAAPPPPGGGTSGVGTTGGGTSGVGTTRGGTGAIAGSATRIVINNRVFRGSTRTPQTFLSSPVGAVGHLGGGPPATPI